MSRSRSLPRVSNLLSRLSSGTNCDQPDDRPSPAVVVPLSVDALGIESRLKKLQGHIGDHKLCSIGILGPAGVGKTTLLKALNNEFLQRKHGFHVVIFAPVPRDSNLETLQATVAKRLGLPWRESESRDTRAVQISMALENKKFLLVLDGLWSCLNLDEIGIPLADSNSSQNKYYSKVLFATRSEEICSKMGANVVYKVDPLDPQAAKLLFQKCLGGVASRQEIVDVADHIVEECKGLPLAVITVGRSMALVTRRGEWIESLEAMKQLRNKLPAGNADIVPMSQFYFSYQMLSRRKLRDCLLYCSLFPKNCTIEKEDLIRCWMGEGLLEEDSSIAQARREGEEVIGKLKYLGMLEDGDNPDSNVMMHDIMCDLALLIKSKEFMVQAGNELTAVPEEAEASRSSEDIEKVSLMYNNIKALKRLPASPRLKTLILRRNRSLRKVQDGIFRGPNSLHLLDLSHTRIETVPADIGSLVSLRHLDLSFTKIRMLPKEIGNLANLVQLLLEGTNFLAKIPREAIPRLTKILVLDLYSSFGEWELKDCQTSPGGEEGCMASIEELECLDQLNDLGITICSTPALKRFTESSKLARPTRRLLVRDCEDLESVDLSSPGFENLQQVVVSDCIILKKLVIGRFLHLEVLRLKALYDAQIIWSMGEVSHDCLPMLRELDISYCHELRNISWVLKLGSLESINLDTCNKIEQVVANESRSGGGKFLRLKTLTLRNLPLLKGICDVPVSFPLLESVKVLGCPQLKSLPRTTDDTDEFSVFVHGETAWWNALERKDGEEKRTPFWYFQASSDLP